VSIYYIYEGEPSRAFSLRFTIIHETIYVNVACDVELALY
jgi:hypothetical protein